MKIDVRFLWIPKAFGGHSSTPWPGMRVEARRQSNTFAVDASRDLVCEELSEFDSSSNVGFGTFRFYLPPDEEMATGTVLEFRNGRRLLGIAKIT